MRSCEGAGDHDTKDLEEVSLDGEMVSLVLLLTSSYVLAKLDQVANP